MKKTKAKDSNTVELEQKANTVVGVVGNVLGIQDHGGFDIGIDPDDPVFNYSEPSQSTVVESDLDDIFNNLILNPKTDDKTMSILIDSSRYTSVCAIRFMQVVLQTKIDELKEHGTWSLSLYADSESKKILKTKLYDHYLKYTNPNFICKNLTNIGYTKPIYNLNDIINTFELFLENALKDMNIIDEDNMILDKERYLEVYKKCRLYLHENETKDEFISGKINVFKSDGSAYIRKTSDFIDGNRELNWSFDINNTNFHNRITSDSIIEIYEDVLGIRFIDNPFTMLVS